MISPEADYFEVALKLRRAEFVRDCPFYFLVGAQVLKKRRVPHRTDIFEVITGVEDPPVAAKDGAPLVPIECESTRASLPNKAGEAVEEEGPLPLVLAIRKIQEAFPSMITVGRTQNNDIVLADVMVSRFHAFFKVHMDRVEIGDAGSVNGTFVGKKRLVSKGPTEIVIPGDTIRFSHIRFEFLEPGAVWDRVQALGE